MDWFTEQVPAPTEDECADGRSNRLLSAENLRSPIKGKPSGPLSGLTFVAKDLFDVAGHRTSNGSPDFHHHAKPSLTNAIVISKLLAAGATLTGMTICDEFFYSLTGANAHYGTPINLRAPGRLPGGSSSGSAAAMTAGISDFAVGSDTGGSVRIPASFCGLGVFVPAWDEYRSTVAEPWRLALIQLAGLPMTPNFSL